MWSRISQAPRPAPSLKGRRSGAMKGFDFEHPFFDPLWIRIVVFGLCMGWGLFELILGAPFWAILFWGLGVWCGHSFFVKRLHRGEGTE